MKIIVVGAGIIGTVAALQLQRAGHQVLLIEAAEPGMQCSYGNGGALSPDFCVPFALPGMLRRIPRWFFDPDGPFFVDWRYLMRSLPWLFEWWRQSQLDKVWHNAKAMRALHAPCIDLYETLLGNKAEGLIERGGSIYVWKNTRSGPTEQLAKTIRKHFDIEIHALQGAEIRDYEPDLNPAYTNALFFPNNGHTVNPLRLTQTVLGLFETIGGRLIKDEVIAPNWQNGALVGVQGRNQIYLADKFIIAAGIQSRDFAKKMGDRVLLQAERGYHVMLPRPGIRPRLKISNRDYMFGLASMEEGVRISGTVEIAEPDAPMRASRATSLLRLAQEMYPNLQIEGATSWMGSRPSTPDCLPVVGPSAQAANVLYAFGHGHSGLMAAPMTAQLLVSLVNGSPPPIDPAPYRVSRF